jgi:hypothetical protein
LRRRRIVIVTVRLHAKAEAIASKEKQSRACSGFPGAMQHEVLLR